MLLPARFFRQNKHFFIRYNFNLILGFTGSDCSFSKIVDLQKGEKIGSLLILVGASLVFGLVVGFILLWYLNRKTEKEELRGIKEEENNENEEDEENEGN